MSALMQTFIPRPRVTMWVNTGKAQKQKMPERAGTYSLNAVLDPVKNNNKYNPRAVGCSQSRCPNLNRVNRQE